MTKRKPMLAMGPMSAKSAGMPHHIANGADFSDLQQDRRFCNASMPAMTPQDLRRLLPGPSTRPGAEDHRKFTSRGV